MLAIVYDGDGDGNDVKVMITMAMTMVMVMGRKVRRIPDILDRDCQPVQHHIICKNHHYISVKMCGHPHLHLFLTWILKDRTSSFTFSLEDFFPFRVHIEVLSSFNRRFIKVRFEDS